MANLTKEEMEYLVSLLQGQEDTQLAVKVRNGELNIILAQKLQEKK